ncbi:MAG TPA: MlaD family protein [Candidatus Acidoferrales bacterium]|jgi:phospholipid/cholesterol/gamma-HCH transport system substrate-binding protein|nr:MlaD family protein [Candidatus Acidoferrales bacterium]
MAQRKQLSWTELRVGLFVLAGLAILAVAVFYVTGAGFLGPKYRLITYLPEVDGLETGAPVRLDGVAVGNVQSLGLTPHPQDSDHNITLVLRIDKKYQNDIRTDSTASLITEGLLGNRYVTISRGLTGSVIPPNGVIPGKEEAAMKQMVERGADLMQNLGALSNDLRGIVQDVHSGRGTLGKLMNDPSLYNHLDTTVGHLDTVVASIQKGQGTLGKLVNSDEMYTKTSMAMDHINNVLGAVQDQKGTFGKFVYDPAMYDSAKSLMEKGNTLFDGINEGKGSLGKLVHDDALYNDVRDASANVRDATAKLNSSQGTLGKFFTDPAFYDNVTGLTGDMRLFIDDFRQHPSKFLHIKLGVF